MVAEVHEPSVHIVIGNRLRKNRGRDNNREDYRSTPEEDKSLPSLRVVWMKHLCRSTTRTTAEVMHFIAAVQLFPGRFEPATALGALSSCRLQQVETRVVDIVQPFDVYADRAIRRNAFERGSQSEEALEMKQYPPGEGPR